MACSMGQVTAPTTPSNIFVVRCQPGSTVILSSTSASADVFLGTDDTVTDSTGAPMDTGGPTVFTLPPMAAPFDIYATAGTGTHVVGYVTYNNS